MHIVHSAHDLSMTEEMDNLAAELRALKERYAGVRLPYPPEEEDDEAMDAFVPVAPFTVRCCTCGGYQAPSLWQRMRRWLRGRRAHH